MAGLTRAQRAAKAAEAAKVEAVAPVADAVTGSAQVVADPAPDEVPDPLPLDVADTEKAMEVAESFAAALDAPQEDAGLVLMAKEGESLNVHPTCVRAHINAGWKVVTE